MASQRNSYQAVPSGRQGRIQNFSSQSQGHPALLQWSAVPAEVFSAVPANPLPVRCIAGALGFSAEDTAEAIGLMANSGIKASQAGTSLRTIMNNLSGEVTFVGKNIGEVTIATSNADGSMRSLNDILADCRVAFSGLSESEKAANAEALVGKNAMSGFLALMNSSETDINKLRGAIENCDGASESMAETMQDNLNGQLTILKSQLEELAISFGDILMPTIRKIVSAVQQFVDKLNSMDESTGAWLIVSLLPLLVIEHSC